MKRIIICLAVAASMLAMNIQGMAQAPAGAAQPRSQRIYIVNIAKVLRDFKKANASGADITTKRQAYVNQVNILREQLAAINKEFTASQVPEEKKKLQAKALEVQRKVEDLDREAQAELTKLSNDTIVTVYTQIKAVIKDIAEANSMDMVLCYPAASKMEDETSPQVAQLMLQTPAMIPFYHKGLDITDVVIQTLNARHPGPVTPVGGAAPAPSPSPMPNR